MSEYRQTESTVYRPDGSVYYEYPTISVRTASLLALADAFKDEDQGRVNSICKGILRNTEIWDAG